MFFPRLTSATKRMVSTVVDKENMVFGGGRATVFAQHGAPGSHKDYKYIVPGLRQKDIRVVSINYPGHGQTQNDDRLTWSNVERNNFSQAIIEGLRLAKKKNLVFMGHSRGAENSIQLGALHKDEAIGIVLLNSTGVMIHKGYHSWAPRIKVFKKFVDNKMTRKTTYSMLEWAYNNIVKLRVPSGEAAAVSMLPILTLDFEKMIPHIQTVANEPHLKVFFGFTGKDYLSETAVSEDLAKRLGGDREHFVYKEKACKEENQKIAEDLGKSFSEGRKLVTALFEEDDHFINKTRAHCVVETIGAIVSHHEKMENPRKKERKAVSTE